MENRKIRELYAQWRFNADLMTCNECGYSVIATRMHETAHHAAGCKHEGERNPWMQLAEILEALKAGDGLTPRKQIPTGISAYRDKSGDIVSTYPDGQKRALTHNERTI